MEPYTRQGVSAQWLSLIEARFFKFHLLLFILIGFLACCSLAVY